MDEQQKATGKGPPDVTDDVASWLEAERAPAFAITPLSATLLAANAEGARLLGLENANSRPVPLDSAMPAIMDLRRIINGTSLESRITPLVFWTSDGMSRLRCNVEIRQVEGEKIALVAIVAGTADKCASTAFQPASNSQAKKQSPVFRAGPAPAAPSHALETAIFEKPSVKSNDGHAAPPRVPVTHRHDQTPTAAPYRTQSVQQSTPASMSVRTAPVQRDSAPHMPPRTPPPPVPSTKNSEQPAPARQSDKETLKAIARQILAGRNETAPETDSAHPAQHHFQKTGEHAGTPQMEKPLPVRAAPLQPPEFASPESLRTKGNDASRVVSRHGSDRMHRGPRPTTLSVPTPLHSPATAKALERAQSKPTDHHSEREDANRVPRVDTVDKRDVNETKFADPPKSHSESVVRPIAPSKNAEQPNTDAAPRRTFVSHMAHELKTPLSAIASAAEIMKDQRLGAIGDERYLRYARDIHESARHALTVIERLLGQPRSPTTPAALSFTNLDLNATANGIVSGLESMARNAGLTLQSDLAVRLPLVVADATSVRQIVLNLLTNALKFTPPGGQVLVKTARTRGGDLTLSVTDTGPGIPPDDIARIMRDNTSITAPAPSSARKPEGGLGIGLPLARRLAGANGGSLSITNTPTGGTEVTLTFPISRQIPI